MNLTNYTKMQMIKNYEKRLENETNEDRIELYKSIICNLERDLKNDCYDK